MTSTAHLEAFWFSFPEDPHLPFGIGVTAYSEADARALLAERGVDAWFSEAGEVQVASGVRMADLDQKNVAPNVGPMQLRGVWYPCMNVGFGAPRSPELGPLPETKRER